MVAAGRPHDAAGDRHVRAAGGAAADAGAAGAAGRPHDAACDRHGRRHVVGGGTLSADAGSAAPAGRRHDAAANENRTIMAGGGFDLPDARGAPTAHGGDVAAEDLNRPAAAAPIVREAAADACAEPAALRDDGAALDREVAARRRPGVADAGAVFAAGRGKEAVAADDERGGFRNG